MHDARPIGADDREKVRLVHAKTSGLVAYARTYLAIRNYATVTSMANDATGSVQSVDRALAIMEILARHGEAGVTEIAVELDVHKSTAFRLVATLETHELVEQTTDGGVFRFVLRRK